MKSQQLGSILIQKISEFDSMLTPTSAAFPDLTAEEIARVKRWFDDPRLTNDPATAQLALSFHSFVVRTGKRTILIDTCNGNHKQRPPAIAMVHMLDRPDYMNNLARLGLSVADIDMVLCTHLHFDHVGWNTRLQDGRWVPTFPNAKYLFTRKDFEHFERTCLEEPVHGSAFIDSVLPIMAAGQAQLVDENHAMQFELGEGVWFEASPGHSAGSVVIHARSAGAHAVFSGDVMHHPLQLVRPSLFFPMADADVALATQTRERLIETYADTDTLICPAHFVEPTIGRIESDGDAFKMNFFT